MALINKYYLIDHFGLPSEFANAEDKRLDGPLASAEKRMRSLLSDAVYDPMTVDGFGGTNESDARQLKECQRAEGLLTLSFGLRQLNLKIIEGGGIVASTGWENSRQSFMSEGQVESIRSGFYSEAVDLIAAYIPEPDISEDETADDILDAGSLTMVAI